MATAAATIRQATSNDLTRIAEIYEYYVKNTVITFDEITPTTSFWNDKIDDLTTRKLPFLVAETNDQQVNGFAYASPWRMKPAYRYTVEDTIYLDHDHTRQGLGTALLTNTIAQCVDIGIRQMVAVIAGAGTAASLTLHHRFGFTLIGRLAAVGYKHDQWIDTILMQRDLMEGHSPPPGPDPS